MPMKYGGVAAWQQLQLSLKGHATFCVSFDILSMSTAALCMRNRILIDKSDDVEGHLRSHGIDANRFHFLNKSSK